MLKLPFSPSQIAQLAINDVDVVITLKGGEHIVLAGAAIDALDATSPLQVQFEGATPVSLKGVMLQMLGAVPLTEAAAQIPASEQGQASAKQSEAAEATSQAVASPVTSPAPTQTIEKMLAAGDAQNTHSADPVMIKLSTSSAEPVPIVPPSSHAAPKSPDKTVAVIGDVALSVSLLASEATATINGAFYGPYGGAGASNSSSASVQAAAAVISQNAGHQEIFANPGKGVSFTKLLHLSLVGTGAITSLTISGIPASWSIEGATRNADGSYTINLNQYVSNGGANQYDIPLTYPIVAANSSNPIHSSNQMTLTAGVLQGTDTVNLVSVVTVVVKDVNQPSDLSYIDSGTGKAALVLPAQGIGYTITGGGNDTIIGGAANDTIFSGIGSNFVDGAGGINTLSYVNASSAETINLNTGHATSAAGTDTISHFQIVYGSNHGDQIIAGTNTLKIVGGSGDDTINPVAATGTLTVDGGAGNNVLDLSSASAAEVVDLSAGSGSGAVALVLSNISHVIGSAYADTLMASTSGSWLQAGSGDALLLGRGGNDILQAGGGNVTFDGGGGNDTIIGGSGIDTLTFVNATGAVTVNLTAGTVTGAYGNETISGIERVIGSAFDDTIIGAVANSTLIGGAGTNTLSFEGTSSAVSVNLAAGVASGSFGSEAVSQFQRLIGSSAGSDTLIGAANTTYMQGTNNVLFDSGGASSIVITGTGSNNTLTFANASGAITVNLSAGTVSGAYGNETISGVQHIVGSSYDDTMIGGAGNASLDGAAGNNTLSFSGLSSAVQVNMTLGQASGAFGNETVTHFNKIIGTAYADVLVASNVNTTIDGGGGHDTITGSTTAVTTVTYGQAGGAVLVNLTAGTVSGAYGNEVLTQVRGVIGSAYDDTVVGGVSNGNLDGGGGNNTLSFAGSGSAVQVNLQSGVANGSFGSEAVKNFQTVIGSSVGGDFLKGAADTRVLEGLAGNVTFDGGGAGNLTIIGSGNNNLLTFANATGAVQVDLQTGVATGAYGNQTISGIQKVVGSSVGGDLLRGNANTTLLMGPGGNDTFDMGGAQAVVVTGFGTNNTITFANSNGAVQVDLTSGAVHGAYGNGTVSGVEKIIGSSVGGDLLRGNANTTLLQGLAGNVTFDGGGAVNVTISGVGTNNTLTFAADTVGAVQVNLSSGLVTGAYGNQTISGIQNIIGSAAGGDILIGKSDTRLLQGSSNVTFDAGNASALTVTGTGSNNTLTFANALGAVQVNLTAGTVTGAYGNETVSGVQKVIGSSTGGDYLQGNVNTSLLQGLAGNVTFDAGGASNVTIIGAGIGNTLSFANANAAVQVNLWTGLVSGGYGNETVSGIQKVIGSSVGGDYLRGTLGTTSLLGLAGNVTFDAGGATAINITGAGTNNTLTYANATSAVVVNLGTGTATGGYGNATVSGIDKVIGSAFGGDLLIGTNTTKLLQGLAGNETFDAGGAAAVTIIGAGNNNTLTFANATGAVTVNLTAGTVTGAYGNETISGIQAILGSRYDDTVSGGVANGSIDAGAGSNTLSFNGTNSAVQVDLQAGTASGTFGNETISNFQKVIGSSTGGDFLKGNLNATLLQGLAGNVTFDAGGATAITITGSGSNNTLTFANATGAVQVNLSAGTVTGAYGNETVSGIQKVIGSSAGGDFLRGTTSTTLLQGSAGNVTFDAGGATAITITGSGTNNTLTFGNSTGAVQVNLSAGTVTGAYGNETVSGIQKVIGSSAG
ncbi:beta strand repeat-containing protein, partial [Herbaspirillum rubrisubalbicans]|uniref:beta strand repeat-containing protein n=1 Tax=Herbaspirillum rubrisubalbicans TaxID=80842 RepID=UPI0012E8171E